MVLKIGQNQGRNERRQVAVCEDTQQMSDSLIAFFETSFQLEMNTLIVPETNTHWAWEECVLRYDDKLSSTGDECI